MGAKSSGTLTAGTPCISPFEEECDSSPDEQQRPNQAGIHVADTPVGDEEDNRADQKQRSGDRAVKRPIP